MPSDKCTECKEAYICIKVDYPSTQCAKVKVHYYCRINENNECQIIEANALFKKCLISYENSEYHCKPYGYDLDHHCDTYSDSSYKIQCTDDGFVHKYGKLCTFLPDNISPGCYFHTATCDELNSEICEGFKSGYNKCSLNNNICTEYKIDSYCTVIGGVCQRAENTNNDKFSENEECLFDNEINISCKKKEKKCENYFSESDCENYDDNENNIQCAKINGNNYCKKIIIDDKCKVINGICTNKEDVNIDDTQICSFDDESNPSKCFLRNKICKERYSSSSLCNALDNCAFLNSNKCYEIENDNNCILDNNKECVIKEDITLSNYEKCSFIPKENNDDKDNEKYLCKKITKSCDDHNSDIDNKETNCNTHPRTDNNQCHYFSNSCLNITLDGNCYLDDTGSCVENGSGKLKSNEKCELSDDYLYCGKRELQCSDYDDPTCGDYKPEAEIKLCFNFNQDGSGNCKEVKVDDRCSIDENNECTGNSCIFDENKDRCYYKESNKGNEGSLLKLKEFIILILFFVF